MAVIKAVSSHAPISVAIDYVSKREKTDEKLLSGIGVSPETAKDEMEATKELYGKTGGRTYKHFVQSFAPGENISPEEAHKIANLFAEKCECFKGFEVLVATHKDRDHVHTHFIVNSVNYEDGHKFQMSSKDLQAMKDLSDDICREHGLSITEKGKTFDGKERESIVAWVKEKYQFLQKTFEEKSSKSYINNTAVTVKEAMHTATSKEEFIGMMKDKGYSVDWQDKHKHITFSTTITDDKGNEKVVKVRDSNLNKTFNLGIGKQELESIFKENAHSPIQEQLSENMRQATGAHYRISEYTDAKKSIDKKVEERRTRVEVCVEKHNKAVRAIKATESEKKQLKDELDKCSSVQFLKKHDLQERIDHSNALIDSIRADRNEFLERYGFASVEEMKKYADDFYKAEKTSERISERLHADREEYISSISHINDIKNDSMTDIKMSDADREELKKELKEQFGSRYSDEKFEVSERAVQKTINTGEDDIKQREMSLHDRLEEKQQAVEEREAEREHQEISHHRGRGR